MCTLDARCYACARPSIPACVSPALLAQVMGRTSLHWASLSCSVGCVRKILRATSAALINKQDVSGL